MLEKRAKQIACLGFGAVGMLALLQQDFISATLSVIITGLLIWRQP